MKKNNLWGIAVVLFCATMLFAGILSENIWQPKDANKAFDQEVNLLVRAGYPQAVGMTKSEFVAWLEPLKKETAGHKNFFIVIPWNKVSIAKKMSFLTHMDINKAWWKQRFPMPEASVPEPYLVYDLEKCCLDYRLTADEAATLLVYEPVLQLEGFVVQGGWRLVHDSTIGPRFEKVGEQPLATAM